MSERLYEELASWWGVLCAPEESQHQATCLHGLLTQGLGRLPQTLLELGSGAGHLAACFPETVACTLVDRAQGMLDESRRLNPQHTHLCADFLKLDLGQTFDAVLLHDACMYLLTEADLRAAFAVARAHLAPGGALLVVPDHFDETFEEMTTGGGGVAADGRAARLMEWHWDPDPNDGQVRVDMALLLREADGTVQHVHEPHFMNRFPRASWARWIREAGFDLVESDTFLAVELGAHFLARARD